MPVNALPRCAEASYATPAGACALYRDATIRWAGMRDPHTHSSVRGSFRRNRSRPGARSVDRVVIRLRIRDHGGRRLRPRLLFGIDLRLGAGQQSPYPCGCASAGGYRRKLVAGNAQLSVSDGVFERWLERRRHNNLLGGECRIKPQRFEKMNVNFCRFRPSAGLLLLQRYRYLPRVAAFGCDDDLAC